MSKPPLLVEDIDHLATLTASGSQTFAIILAGGLAFSRKTIKPSRRGWRIRNHIDKSDQNLSTAELWTDSNIGEALDKGALVALD